MEELNGIEGHVHAMASARQPKIHHGSNFRHLPSITDTPDYIMITQEILDAFKDRVVKSHKVNLKLNPVRSKSSRRAALSRRQIPPVSTDKSLLLYSKSRTSYDLHARHRPVKVFVDDITQLNKFPSSSGQELRELLKKKPAFQKDSSKISDQGNKRLMDGSRNMAVLCFLFLIMVQPVSSVLTVEERDVWITFYYQQGFTYKDICGFLLLTHNTVVSLRQLKRILNRLCLRRRGRSSSLIDCLNCIANLYQRGFGECGYRTMWRMMNISRNLCVTQDTVRRLLGIIDTEGVQLRGRHRLRRRQYRNKGPNFAIHVDGYDKLKPYGIAIHGAIDGFSRKILWLEACYSNNDPKIVAGYYLNYIKRTGGVPRLVRADAGTENVLLRDLQMVLRFDDVDHLSGFNSYQTGSSTSNQRIERFWGNLRVGFTVFWRNLFRDMVDSGMLRIDDPVHIELLRFCFMRLIQRDLDSFLELWNLHRIRQQRNVETPCGIPSVLYHQPELFDAQDYSFPLRCSLQCINHLQVTYTKPKGRLGCRDLFIPVLEELCDIEANSLPQPDTVETARELFAALCELITNI